MVLRTAHRRPTIIQGGMGVGVSSWQLASCVARAGQLGMVSGTALDTVLVRRLQDGDPGGHVHRALEDFPLPDVAERVLARYYQPGGRNGAPYTPLPSIGLRPNRMTTEAAVVGNFVEVWLAKEGHSGWIGINFLEKIQMATPAAAYGAMLAGVDAVLMGAGIPRQLPALLDAFSEHRPGTVDVEVTGAEPHPLTLDPADLGAQDLPQLQRPMFLAIISSHVLGAYLCREEVTRPDGFVVEGPIAGGHNAPPRGKMVLDEAGEPVYGPRDDANLAAVARIGLPFWLAGGYGEPEKVSAALEAGASGVQVGTLFALSRESGLAEPFRLRLLDDLRKGTLKVSTNPSASPTGFPFKVAQLEGSLSQPAVYNARPRLCDLSYLREVYSRPDGTLGYRCPAEPIDMYLRKGGDPARAEGAVCLCNALMADVAQGQRRKDGYVEPPLVTLGADLVGARRLDSEHWLHGGSPDGWSAQDVITWLLREVNTASPAHLAPDAIAARVGACGPEA